MGRPSRSYSSGVNIDAGGLILGCGGAAAEAVVAEAGALVVVCGGGGGFGCVKGGGV